MKVTLWSQFHLLCTCNRRESALLVNYLGLGFGLVYNCGVVVINAYFEKYRPLALGLSLTGGAVGNMVFPWLTTGLISEFGWRGLYKYEKQNTIQEINTAI